MTKGEVLVTAQLKRDVKVMIIETLRVPGVSPDQVDDETPIFENPLLNLDSVDALELVVAIQRRNGARIDDRNLARAVLRSVTTIAEFVAESGNAAAPPGPLSQERAP